MEGGEDGGAPRLAAAFPCSDSSVAFTPVSESSERPAGAPDVILDRRVCLANGSVLLLVGTGGGEPSNAVARDPLLPGDATSGSPAARGSGDADELSCASGTARAPRLRAGKGGLIARVCV